MFNLNDGLLKYIVENVISAEWQYYAFYAGFVLVSVVAAYLLGSLNSAIIVSKLLYGEDIRTFGSGNDLVFFKGKETFLVAKLLQSFRFCDNIPSQVPVVNVGSIPIGKSTG